MKRYIRTQTHCIQITLDWHRQTWRLILMRVSGQSKRLSVNVLRERKISLAKSCMRTRSSSKKSKRSSLRSSRTKCQQITQWLESKEEIVLKSMDWECKQLCFRSWKIMMRHKLLSLIRSIERVTESNSVTLRKAGTPMQKEASSVTRKWSMSRICGIHGAWLMETMKSSGAARLLLGIWVAGMKRGIRTNLLKSWGQGSLYILNCSGHWWFC